MAIDREEWVLRSGADGGWGFGRFIFFFLESVLFVEVSFKLCLDGRDGKEAFDS